MGNWHFVFIRSFGSMKEGCVPFMCFWNSKKNLISAKQSVLKQICSDNLNKLFSACLLSPFFFPFPFPNVAVFKTLSALFMTRSPGQLDSEKGRAAGGGIPVLCLCMKSCGGDCICGSWRNKGLNEAKWAPGGNGKQLERSEACTHVCWLFTLRLGRYTPMHSSAHGGLTRSGSMFSRLT